jgi:glycine/D-amino acid oxidase-like deaminating enzyme
MWEPRLLLLDPARLVRAERDLALRLGVKVYENTPVLEITTRPHFRLKTPEGELTAEKLVFAANAYSHIFPQLRRKQVPAFTYMIATEPLSPRQLEPVGWAGCEGLEDARNLIHYYRITPEGRVVIGGGPVGLTYGNNLNADSSEDAWHHLEGHLHWLFPSLADARITHRWGGPFSVTLNLTPALGYLGDRRAVYSLGCIGHGVSTSHQNAQVLSDLILDRPVEPECPFQDHRVIPWPPEPVRMGVAVALRSYLQLEDWAYERKLRQRA